MVSGMVNSTSSFGMATTTPVHMKATRVPLFFSFVVDVFDKNDKEMEEGCGGERTVYLVWSFKGCSLHSTVLGRVVPFSVFVPLHPFCRG